MISQKEYQEVLNLNQKPLNREAKKWFERTGKKPESDILMILQLMTWGLENGIRAKNNLLPEVVEGLYKKPAKDVLNYLIKDSENQQEMPRICTSDLKEAESPLEAARLLLESLDSRLRADDNLSGIYTS
jgi:hypothetical protein